MKQTELQKKIVEKVNKVLDGMDHQTDFSMYIRAKPDEVVSIRYDVTEFIIPDEDLTTRLK
jgi:hypothetical protein